MINVKVKEFKIKLNDKEYTFRLDFNALMKFEERYKENAINIFNSYLRGEETYSNIIKILSCCCVEKNLEEKELAGLLPFNFKTMKMMDEIAIELASGLINDNKGDSQKNEQTSQNKEN